MTDQQTQTPSTNDSLLAVEDLRVYFHIRSGVARAVDGVSFSIEPGKTLGLVGESGSGKSVTALSILGLVPSPPGRIKSGQIHFNGQDLLALDEKKMRQVRGNKISMIFQEPMTALNPVFTVGAQVAEAFRLHRGASRREANLEAIGMLEKVRIPDAKARVKDYPHQLSGGMRQRVMIAMALACQPDLLIADEPTTALDVTVQAQILELMQELQQDTGAAILLITHDLGVVSEITDHVAVMYAGQIVEHAPTAEIFQAPSHPYTEGLIRSVPNIDNLQQQNRLIPIEGNVPGAMFWPEGCRFRERCPYAQESCGQQMPELKQVTQGHDGRCLFPLESVVR